MARRSRIPRVAILIETSRAFGRGVIEGIAQFVHERGPWSVQFEERGLEDPPPRWLKGWQGDGVIARTATAAMTRAVRATGRPTVELLRNNRAICDIECNHDLVGSMAAEDFLGRGLCSFGFFAFGGSAWIRTRRNGFVRALANRGHDCFIFETPEHRRATMPRWEERRRVEAGRWLQSLPQPIGILCASDVHAMRLLEVCRDCRIAVPEQVAVLGVDNDPVICDMTEPLLSSIDLNSRRIGYEAAELLNRRMNRRSPRGKTLFTPPSHIATRQSTDVLAIAEPDVAEAVRFIRKNAHRGLRASEVVSEVGLSRRTLERRFQQFLGRSLKTEILRVQIDHAKLLLSQSALPIEAVGRRCGFPAFKYFGQVFRRETGVTPRDFRRIQSASNELPD